MSLESVSASLGCIVPTHVLGPSDHAQGATHAGGSDANVEDDGVSAMPESQEGDESSSETPATPKAKAKAKAKAKGKKGGEGSKRKAEPAKAENKKKKRKTGQESADNESGEEGSGETPSTPQTAEKDRKPKATRKEKMKLCSTLEDEETPEEITTGFHFFQIHVV